MQTKRNDAPGNDHRTYHRTSTPGVYKRGNRYVVKVRDMRGKQRERTCRTLAEARATKAELLADIQRGEYRHDTKTTFIEYAEQWPSTYRGRTSTGVRPETLAEYERDLQRAIAYFGRARLAEVSTPMVKQYVEHLSAEGLAASTVRRIMAPVKAMFATAVEDGLMRHNPTAGVRLNIVQTDEEHEEHAKALSPDQVARLMEHIPEEHILMVRLMLQTGLRIGEVLGLRWQDIDSAGRSLNVRNSVRGGKVGRLKTKNSKRTVPLDSSLLDDLAARQEKAAHGGKDDLVFGTSSGAPGHATNHYRWFKKAAKAAGVEWAAFHTLRHTAGSRWVASGNVSIAQVSRMLGHSDPGFTLRVYIHVLPSDLPDGEVLRQAVGLD